MTLACKHCGATTTKSGKPWPHRGALNLHENVHCLKKPVVKDVGGKTIIEQCCGNPSIRLLRRDDSREANAINMGYKKICSNCLEVI